MTNAQIVRRPRGVTLVEILVVLGIIAVLIGLTLPAVQSAREAARRARCMSNLKQLIGATHQFEAAWGGFPPCVTWYHAPGEAPGTLAAYSLHCRLLPYLEQATLYDAMNFEAVLHRESFDGANRTVAATRLTAFLCPSDSNALHARSAANSYRGCFGEGATVRGSSGILLLDARTAGVFSPGPSDGNTGSGVLRSAEIRDGLSNTLAFSEKPITDGVRYQAFRDWSSEIGELGPMGADDWIGTCIRTKPNAPVLNAGVSWLISNTTATLFTSVAPPNSRVPDCGCSAFENLGSYTARSQHPGGVCAAMADGSVHWYGASLDARIWRAMSTRAGGEIVAGESRSQGY